MSNTIQCKLCGADVEVPENYSKPFIKCTSCQKMTNISVPSKPAAGARAPAPASQASPVNPVKPPSSAAPIRSPQTDNFAPLTSSPSPLSSPPSSDKLPEIMKANKKLAGKECDICGGKIELGEMVHNCTNCQATSHQKCWERKGGCPKAECTSTSLVTSDNNKMTAAEAGEDPANMIPCRWCKEKIIRGARKCRHCGEFQSDVDREAAATKNVEPADLELTGFDWFLVVIPCGCGCWVGLVYSIMGKPKGRPMLAYGILSNIIWKLIATILNSL
ncbi:MAG: hypothetical protein HQM10_21750 [Candidatus Riflebacteria bacterium]|nr:hypothetical protein [Candidatus Riflebacteria bacterium]